MSKQYSFGLGVLAVHIWMLGENLPGASSEGRMGNVPGGQTEFRKWCVYFEPNCVGGLKGSSRHGGCGSVSTNMTANGGLFKWDCWFEAESSVLNVQSAPSLDRSDEFGLRQVPHGPKCWERGRCDWSGICGLHIRLVSIQNSWVSLATHHRAVAIVSGCTFASSVVASPNESPLRKTFSDGIGIVTAGD